MASSKPTGLPRLAHGSKSPFKASGENLLIRDPEPSESANVALETGEPSADWIIGDRCYVQGDKRGRLAFLGETRFGAGDWAGVVLEEATGKNDGSVNGIRYFQCAPNCGLFCRISKISRLPNSISGSDASKTLVFNEMGPVSSIKQLTTTTLEERFKLGDRVAVAGQKDKCGSLRFIGPTQFAPASTLKEQQPIWAGIELDNPLGKNDGSVQNIRYFSCKPRYGLFVLADKLVPAAPNMSALTSMGSPSTSTSKLSGMRRASDFFGGVGGGSTSNLSVCSFTSTSSNRPPTIPVKQNVASVLRLQKGQVAAANASMSRHGSHESLCSATSSMISAASKQRRIRLGVTSISSPSRTPKRELLPSIVDDALHEECHKNLAAVKLQMDQLLLSLEQVAIDCKKFENLYEEEKRKNEDLQFRQEEETIARSQLENHVLELENLMKKNDTKSEQSSINNIIPADEIDRLYALFEKSVDYTSFKNLYHEQEKKLLDDPLFSLEKVDQNDKHKDDVLNNKLCAFTSDIAEVRNEISRSYANVEALKLDFAQQFDMCSNAAKNMLKSMLNEKDQLLSKAKLDVESLTIEKNNLFLELSALQSGNKLEESAKIDSLRKENEQFIVDLDRLRQQLEVVSKEREAIKDEMTEFKNTVESLHELQTKEHDRLLSQRKADVENLTTENETLRAKLDALLSKDKLQETLKVELIKKNDKLIIDMADIRQKFDEECRKIQVLQQERNDYRLQAELLPKLESSLKEKEQSLSNERVEFELLTVENRTLRQKFEALQAMNQLEESSKMTSLVEENNKLTVDLSNLCQQLTNESLIVEKLQNEKNQLNELIKSTRKDAEDSIQKLTKILEEKALSNDTLSNDLIKTNLQLEELLKRNVENTNQLSISNTRYDEKNVETLRLEENLQKLQLDFERIVLQNEQYKSENDNLKLEILTIPQIEEKLLVMKNLCEDSQERYKELESFQTACTSENSRLRNDLEHYVQCIESLERQSEVFQANVLEERSKFEGEICLKNSEISDLKNKLDELSSGAKVDVNRLTSEISSTNSRCQHLESLLLEQKSEWEKSEKELKASIDVKVTEVNELQKAVKNLQQTNDQHLKNIKRIEQDNVILMSKIDKKQSLLSSADVNDKNHETSFDVNGLNVEKQISFLNAIIVDLTKKNVEMQQKLDIFYSPNAGGISDLNSTNEKHQKPPRTFCDICDVFDAHETENCPQQQTIVDRDDQTDVRDDGDAVGYNKSKRTRRLPNIDGSPKQRPYCQICETFGHETEGCDMQTF